MHTPISSQGIGEHWPNSTSTFLSERSNSLNGNLQAIGSTKPLAWRMATWKACIWFRTATGMTIPRWRFSRTKKWSSARRWWRIMLAFNISPLKWTMWTSFLKKPCSTGGRNWGRSSRKRLRMCVCSSSPICVIRTGILSRSSRGRSEREAPEAGLFLWF